MERKLKYLDEIDLENGEGDRLRSRKDDLKQARREKTESERAGLLENIRSKLVHYGE
jgi:hypothetical protein